MFGKETRRKYVKRVVVVVERKKTAGAVTELSKR